MNNKELEVFNNAEKVQDRYCLTSDNFPREVVLLKSFFCAHRKCTFCDYWADGTKDKELMIKVAEEELSKLTGETGVLEVINSGSIFELPKEVLAMIQDKVREKEYHTLMYETHYMYRHRLNEIEELFPDIRLIPKTGVETFDYNFREDVLNKGFKDAKTAEDVASYFKGINLLIGIKGQTIDMIEFDIKKGLELFEVVIVNIFTENAKDVNIDQDLIDEFYKKLGHIRENKKVLLYDHKNGVGLG